MILVPLECSSDKNRLTYDRILSSGSSNSMQMSTISPLSLSMSFNTRWVMTIKACLLTWFCSSWSNPKIWFVLSFKQFGNLLKRSPNDTMMFALIPKSIFDFRRPKTRSRFSWQIFDETHMNLLRARIADLSKMQISGAYYYRALIFYAPLTLYLAWAWRATPTIGSKNCPSNPSCISFSSVILVNSVQYYSISASFPPVICARSSFLSFSSSD